MQNHPGLKNRQKHGKPYTRNGLYHSRSFLVPLKYKYSLFALFQMCIHRYRVFARFGLMHMMATNICVWLRTVVMETINDVQFHLKSTDNRIHGLDLLSHMFTNRNVSLTTLPTTLSPSTTTTPTPLAHHYLEQDANQTGGSKHSDI